MAEKEQNAINNTVLCKNCKWCEPSPGWGFWSRLKWQYAKCARTEEFITLDPSPVDGRVLYKNHRYLNSCETERSSAFDNCCGKTAKYFEAKK